ncbi:MAG: ATP-binding protein [Acidimicrobiia bacterium]
MKRSVALAWVVLVILAAQAVREEAFVHLGLSLSVVLMAIVLIASSLLDWQRIMPAKSGPWATLAWIGTIIVCLIVIGSPKEMQTLASPMFFGLVALSGLVLDRVKHVIVSVLAVAGLGFLSFLSETTQVATLLVQIFSVVVVATATALMGYEFEQESVRSARRLTDLQRQRADFERLYAVSTTLAGADSLAEVLPELVGRICNYLNAQVGVVMLYVPDTHELRLMNPLWVSGYPVEAGDFTVPVSTGGVLAQVFKSGKPLHLDRISDRPDAFGILGELGLSDVILAPLRVEQFKVGVIAVGDPATGTFGEDQAEALSSLGAPAALVLSQLGRYEAVAEMTRRLEEVAQMKTDFVSVVSHELRTPLTSIIGSLDTVARPELAPDTEAARNLLSTARRQAGRLQRLIEDLLIVSRLERNAVPIQLEKVVLETFLADVVGALQIAQVQIDVEPADLNVLSDPDHLERVFLNLLENAVKYAPDSPVEVKAIALANQVEVSVIDHGFGIPAGQRERIFHRFTQLEGSATRTRGGTGLGLNIVKGLAEAMKGGVEMRDTPGGGATFVVTLPRTAPVPLAAAGNYSTY